MTRVTISTASAQALALDSAISNSEQANSRLTSEIDDLLAKADHLRKMLNVINRDIVIKQSRIADNNRFISTSKQKLKMAGYILR